MRHAIFECADHSIVRLHRRWFRRSLRCQRIHQEMDGSTKPEGCVLHKDAPGQLDCTSEILDKNPSLMLNAF